PTYLSCGSVLGASPTAHTNEPDNTVQLRPSSGPNLPGPPQSFPTKPSRTSQICNSQSWRGPKYRGEDPEDQSPGLPMRAADTRLPRQAIDNRTPFENESPHRRFSGRGQWGFGTLGRIRREDLRRQGLRPT